MPLRILIADDNLVFRSTLRQVLHATDHWEIIEANDGQEAIAKAVEMLPDAIVLDLAMPVKDGLSAAREISSLLPQTPIVMYTMHTSPQVESEAMKSGVRKVVSKSDSALLVETVRQLLPASQVPDSVGTVEPLAVPDPATTGVTVLPSLPSTPEEASVEPPAPPPPLPKNVA